MNQQELLGAMKLCAQNEHQSVYDHGMSVAKHYVELIRYVDEGSEEDPLEFQWKFPAWICTHRREILDVVYNGYAYAKWHDCGKPFCREIDSDGKVHFPDHAAVSKRIFQEVFADDPRLEPFPETANLIGWDMCLHTFSADEIDRYCREVWTVRDAVTLLCMALAEIHSNAKMFGGIDTTSFKSKWKQIDRRGKQILKFYFSQVTV